MMQNGSIGEGAVQAVGSNAAADALDSRADGRDAIREGKEKAKAVMAASGVAISADDADGASSEQSRDKSPSTASDIVNGASPSRKRSRSGSRIPSHPPRSEPHEQPSVQEHLLDLYLTRDELYAAATIEDNQRLLELTQQKVTERDFYKQLFQLRQSDPGAIFGHGYAGYGNGITEARQTRLEYPGQKRRPGNRRAKQVRLSRKDMSAQADQLEELVPVRLDIEFDKIKLRDTFTWNLHDRVTPPDIFAETLVEDFKLPPEAHIHVLQQVHREILEQTQDFYPHVYIEEEALDPSLPYYAYKNDEMRILIKLNITIGQHTLVDQFEWEINNPMNSPEEFARHMAHDLSLSGEFTTAIAHSIREQSQMFTKSLYITGHPFDGRPVEDADIRESFLPSPLPTVFRPVQSAKEYSPYLYELSEAELERTELSILREQRRQKRGLNRRGGPALPDLKDRQRTVRTLLLSSVLPGAVEAIEDSRLYKVSARRDGRGRRPGVRADGADDSDESEEEESEEESVAAPVVPQTGTTARTRNIRGAAQVAQVAMRQTAVVRSATPEVAQLHHHETRTSARRFPTSEREESVATTEPSSLIVKLRIGKEKLRLFIQNLKNKPQGSSGGQQGSQQNTPQRSTPVSSMPPPPSPAAVPTSIPKASNSNPEASPKQEPGTLPGGKQWHYYPDGRADAPYPLPPGQSPAPPPSWLTGALQSLHKKYPHDSFEALMRYSAVDTSTPTPQPVRLDIPPGSPLPANTKYQYLPRIRCNDCPGKLYTAGPELTVDNFEVHLKNRQHRQKVEERRRKAGGS